MDSNYNITPPPIVEKIYVGAVVLAMGLLFYANAEQQWTPDGNTIDLGIGKAFYAPCAVALICSFFIKKVHDRLDRLLTVFMLIACFSTLIHPQDSGNYLSWTIVRLLLGILCFIRLRSVDSKLIVKYFAIASPIIVFPHYIVTNPFAWGAMRYGGCYGDPNYLAMSLNFLNILCYIYIKNGNNIFIKIGAGSSIIGTIPLIMLGMSRGGLLGLFAIIILMLFDLFKRNKMYFCVVLFAIAISSSSFMYKMSDNIDNIATRFSSDSYSDVRSTEFRIEGIESCINVLSNQPLLIPFGIGPGNTFNTIPKYKQYGYYTRVIIHCTPFAVLYEIGIFAFLIFCYIIIALLHSLYVNKRYLLFVFFLATTISVLSLQALVFMPFWIILFILSKESNFELVQID